MRVPAALLASTLALLVLGPGAVLAPASARAQAEDDISAGKRLEATTAVTLQGASVMKGSRVGVTKVSRKDGRIVSVDVELADGHVVAEVGIVTVRRAFKVVAGS